MRAAHRALSASAFCLVMCTGSVGRADSESERTKLYQQGKALAEAGKFAAAAKKFREVIAIRSAPKALIALAAMEEKRGRLVAARALYVEAERDAIAAKLTDDAGVAATARLRVDETIPRLTIRVATDVATPTTSIDDTAVAAPWIDIAVDPGVHLIAVSAPGYETFTVKVTLKEREHREVEATMRRSVDSVDTRLEDRTVAWGPVILGGGGVLVGLTGLLVYSSGRADEEARRDVCPNLVCPDGESTNNPGRSKIIAGDVMMLTGGAAAIGGLVWYFTRRGDAPPTAPTAGARVRPSIAATASGATFSLAGSF